MNLAEVGRRLLPHFVYEPFRRFVTGGRRVELPEVPERWLKRIAELCAESNTRLAAQRGLPLRGLGYPMSGDAAVQPISV